MNIFTVLGKISFFYPVLDEYVHFISSPDIAPQVELDILCGDLEDKV